MDPITIIRRLDAAYKAELDTKVGGQLIGMAPEDIGAKAMIATMRELQRIMIEKNTGFHDQIANEISIIIHEEKSKCP